jgi:hypothetical protein
MFCERTPDFLVVMWNISTDYSKGSEYQILIYSEAGLYTESEKSWSVNFGTIFSLIYIYSSLEMSSLLRFSSTKYSNKNACNVNQLNNTNTNFYWKYIYSRISVWLTLDLVRSHRSTNLGSVFYLPGISPTLEAIMNNTVSKQFTAADPHRGEVSHY